MIAASTYLPSASSSTTAASSIHGTGAQNFSIAIRNGCSDVSGIALGPNFSGRRRASSLVRPFCGLTSAALADLGFDPGLDTLNLGHFGVGFHNRCSFCLRRARLRATLSRCRSSSLG